MIHDRQIINVRNIALFLVAGPLTLLLGFAALNMSWAKHSSQPTKANVATELTPKVQPASTRDQ
ncbi:hypothetical protein ACQ4M3_28440 [Leptolyngbya sp. AN03gr2]|uniref:hypothetical protein n=1 Tax=unclassified Leptolyngbya TaxID=2650499 RepID=UPI003D319A84